MRKTLLLGLLVFLITHFQLQAQNRMITGTVTRQEEADGLEGTTVTIKGTNVSTGTDRMGTFKLRGTCAANGVIVITTCKK